MIIALFVVTFLVAVAVSALVVRIFTKPIDSVLHRIVQDDISRAWSTYMRFAIYVVGIGGGVNVWDFERFLGPMQPGLDRVELTNEWWALEIYRTIIGTLQSTTMILLVFFVFALIAYVIVRGLETRRQEPPA